MAIDTASELQREEDGFREGRKGSKEIQIEVGIVISTHSKAYAEYDEDLLQSEFRLFSDSVNS